jgi:hypothetical protein
LDKDKINIITTHTSISMLPMHEAHHEQTNQMESTSEPLSPEMQELAQIVAKCIRERGEGQVQKEVLHNTIKTHGSRRLNNFWKIKYATRVTSKTWTRFREYRDRLLDEMLLENEAEHEHDGGLEVIEESMDMDVYGDEPNDHHAEENDGEEVNYDDNDEDSTYSDDAKPPPKPTRQNKSTSEPLLPPELQEMAQLVATFTHETGQVRQSRDGLADMVRNRGSARLKKFWKTRSKTKNLQNNLVGKRHYPTYRAYRDRLLAEMAPDSKVDSSVDLSPTQQELAQILAKCLYESRDIQNRVAPEVVQKQIAKFGSKRLKRFWQKKSKLPCFTKHGLYVTVISSKKKGLFRAHRDELLARMVAGENTEFADENVDKDKIKYIGKSAVQDTESVDAQYHNAKGNVDGIADEVQYNNIGDDNDDAKQQTDSRQKNQEPPGAVSYGDDDEDSTVSDDAQPPTDKSTSERLSPELQEIAQIVATFIHERGDRRPRKEDVASRIMTLGSARLKKIWKIRSKTKSGQKRGFAYLVGGRNYPAYRLYRDRLVAELVAKSKAAGTVDLSLELQELAQIMAKCRFEKRYATKRLPEEVVQNQIAKFGSKRLKLYWQKKSKLPCFTKPGLHTACIKSPKYPIFREYENELLAQMVAGGKTDSADENVAEDKIKYIGKSAVQDTKCADAQNDIPNGSVYDIDDEVQDNNIGDEVQDNNIGDEVQDNNIGDEVQDNNIGDEVQDNNIGDDDSTKQNQEPPSVQLSAEVQELAQLVAQCRYETMRSRSMASRELLTSKIANQGSARLKHFWKTKSALPSVMEWGHLYVVPRMQRAIFLSYRDQLVAEISKNDEHFRLTLDARIPRG